MAERQLHRGRARDWLAIEAVLQDRDYRAVGLGADLETTPAGDLEPGDAVLASESHDADGGAEALPGTREAAQDDLDHGGGVGSDDGGLVRDVVMVPVCVTAMGRRHMIGRRGVPAARATEHMAGYTLALVEQLDRTLGDARLELLLAQ